MQNFINKRKKDKRRSLLIDNLDVFKQQINTIQEQDETDNSTLNSLETLTNRTETHVCQLCNNNHDIKDNFIILSCGHIFHVKCIIEHHFKDINQFDIINQEYLNTLNCPVCNEKIEYEDLLYIHNKFYKQTKQYIIKQDEAITDLEKQMTKLKDQLRSCYEYKQKLQNQGEKSKQIIMTINTLI